MKNGDFITILAPMSSKLKLSGNNLLVFALIHGFSKDGEHAFYGSISYISSWLNISKNSVIDTLRVLTESGLLIKNEEIKNGVKFCNYKSQYDSILKKLDSGCEIAPVVAKKKRGGCKSQQGSCETGHNNNKDIDINIDNIKEDTNVSKKDCDNSNLVSKQVDELYDMYPTKCPKRNVSLGKSFKCKDKLKKLIKQYGYEMLKFTISKECEEKYGKSYMSNFSTFLNNLPDYGYVKSESNEASEVIDNKSNDININGVTYK